MKILIAEDDAIVRRLLQSYLVLWGHEVVSAQNGAEAWDRFISEEFPMVISDWMMPQLDGVGLIRRIRDRRDSGYTYFILLTARAHAEDIVEGMEAGADDFVVKPFDREELRVRIRAGERLVLAEKALEEQNRALLRAQESLSASGTVARVGPPNDGIAFEVMEPIQSALLHLTTLHEEVTSLVRHLDRYREALGAGQPPPDRPAIGPPSLDFPADLDGVRAGLALQLARCDQDLRRASVQLSELRTAAD